MFKNLTYKQKIKSLPFVFGTALLLVYILAVQKTLQVRKECSFLSAQIDSVGDAPKEMVRIQSKLQELNSVMGKDTTGIGSDPLLEFVSNNDAGSLVTLVDFQPFHIFEHPNYKVETRVAVFEGSFLHLLKFLYNIEKGFRSGKIVSVKFETETNLKTVKKRLLMTILLQSVVSSPLNSVLEKEKKL